MPELRLFAEPESALSIARPFEFLKLPDRMDRRGHAPVIVATRAPALMAPLIHA